MISNVDARPHDDPEEIRRLLVRQIVQPVLWEDSMRYLLAAGFRPVLRNRPRPGVAGPVAADRSESRMPERGCVKEVQRQFQTDSLQLAGHKDYHLAATGDLIPT